MGTFYEQKSAELEIASIIRKLLFPQNSLYFPTQVLFILQLILLINKNWEIVSSYVKSWVIKIRKHSVFCVKGWSSSGSLTWSLVNFPSFWPILSCIIRFLWYNGESFFLNGTLCDWVLIPNPDVYSLRPGLDPMPLLVGEIDVLVVKWIFRRIVG